PEPPVRTSPMALVAAAQAAAGSWGFFVGGRARDSHTSGEPCGHGSSSGIGGSGGRELRAVPLVIRLAHNHRLLCRSVTCARGASATVGRGRRTGWRDDDEHRDASRSGGAGRSRAGTDGGAARGPIRIRLAGEAAGRRGG